MTLFIHSCAQPGHFRMPLRHSRALLRHSHACLRHSHACLRHSREGGNPQNPQTNVNLRSLVQSLSIDSRLRGNDVVGASEYQFMQSLPENLQSQLLSVEEIEQELGGEL